MSALLTFDSVSVRTPDGRTLFENLSFTLGRERVGGGAGFGALGRGRGGLLARRGAGPQEEQAGEAEARHAAIVD